MKPCEQYDDAYSRWLAAEIQAAITKKRCVSVHFEKVHRWRLVCHALP